MARRKTEPEEAFGPALDGLRGLELNLRPIIPVQEALPLEDEEYLTAESAGDALAEPVLLLFGATQEAKVLASLAEKCGFAIAWASQDENAADAACHVPDLENIVQLCGIDRNYFVCIFLEDIQDCELILSQCLASDAFYLGLYGDRAKCEAVFQSLREDGAPDAELAAIAAPMGLNIGAVTPEQTAVAIVAEMLAARAGKLKRLRH